MMSFSARVPLLLVVLALAQQPARDSNGQLRQGTAVVSGTIVTDDKTPQPVRRARVVLSSGARADNEVATSDDGGRFVFRGVPVGRYTVQANKAPYLPMFYGASRAERPGTPIAVTDGQTVSGLTIRMTRGGALEGRVLDPRGEPMPFVSVSAMRYQYSVVFGGRALGTVAIVTSDDRGVYRAFGLAPGEYVIVTRPPLTPVGRGVPMPPTMKLTAADVDRILQSPQSTEPARTPSGAPVGWSPVYYPGTPELAAAARIKLDPGEEQSGLDISMRLVPTSRITGVVKVPEGASIADVVLTIIPADPEARANQNLGFVTSARPDADGRYTFADVTPGSFVLNARSGGNRGGRGAGVVAGSPTLWASANLTVEGRDLDIPLTLQPGIPVSGRVEIKTTTPMTPAEIAGLRMMMRAVDSGPNLSDQPAAQVTEAQTFNFNGVVPARFIFLWSKSGGPDLFPTSLTIRGREMLDGPFEINSAISDMTIFFTDRPSEITGTLQDTSGRPATDYFIVVYSTNRAYWAPFGRRILQARPGSDGKYILRGLPAGEYFLSALTDLAPGDTSDPAFLEQLTPTAVKVTVTDGATIVQPFRIGG